jgi:hypothetical protein
MRNLLLFGVVSAVCTVLPLHGFWGYVPDAGRLGLAVTLIALLPRLLSLGEASHIGHERTRARRPVEESLPRTAREIIDHIDEQLDALAAPHFAAPVMTEDTFAVAEMRTRYLPSTIDAYLAIPPVSRPDHAERFISQLRLLDAAAGDLLQKAALGRAAELDVNGRFLAGRFH